MDDIRALGQQFDAKLAEHKGLQAKGEGLTQEDVLKMETLTAEMRDIKTRVESVRKVGDLAATAGELEAWSKASAGAPVVPAAQGVPSGGGFGVFGNGVSLLGFEKAGDTHFNPTAKGLQIVSLDAEGQIDKAFKPKAFQAAHSSEYLAAWNGMIRKGWGNLSNAEQATLQEGQDTAGGFLAPSDVLARVVGREPTPTRLRGRVTNLTTSKGDLLVPKVNYTADDLYTTGIRVTWTGETVSGGATSHRVTEPVFGQDRIEIFTAMLSIPLTQDLVEDSGFDLMAYLGNKFGETIELLKDNMILNGTGVNQPLGLVTAATAGTGPAVIVSGSAAALTGDGLINLTEGLPEQYDENAVLVFNKTNTGKAIRLLKDGDGKPLVTYGAADNGLAGGRYREINGYPYLWSGFAPNVAANSYPIIFGDLTGYYEVDRVGFSMRILSELYAETNQLVVLGRVRFGGKPVEPWRMKAHKVAAA